MNVGKYEVMHFGRRNLKASCYLNEEQWLFQLVEYRDLGILDSCSKKLAKYLFLHDGWN